VGVLTVGDLDVVVFNALDRIERGQPLEDSRLELKSDWSATPAEHHRYARQIAALCNAARGGEAVLVVGVSERHGVVGCNGVEVGAWWRTITRWLDDPPPEPHARILHSKGKSVVALMFDTSYVPMVVRRPMENAGRLVPDHDSLEIPWRGVTDARSARRRDLVEMLLASAQAPQFEIIEGLLDLVATTRGADGPQAMRLTIRTYVDLPVGADTVIPKHRCAGYVVADEVDTPIMFDETAASVEVLAPFPTWAVQHRPEQLALASAGHNQVILHGPGPVKLLASVLLQDGHPWASAQRVRVDLQVGMANTTARVPVSAHLERVDHSEQTEGGMPLLGRWRTHTSKPTLADERAEIDLALGTERLDGAIVINGTSYKHPLHIWATVTNYGAGGEFQVRARDVQGLSGGTLDAAGAPVPLAWENVFGPTQRISRTSASRVKVASVAPEPFAFWFWLPESASYSRGSHAAGIQHQAGYIANEVSFVLDVQNVGTDALRSFDVTINFDPETREPIPTFVARG